MIVFSCRWCGKRYERPETSAGTVVFCTCGTSNLVPWASAVLEAPAAVEKVPPAPLSGAPGSSPGHWNWDEPAPTAARRDPGLCFNHKDTPAQEACAECAEHFCPDCVTAVGGRTLCGPCKNFVVRRLQRPPSIAVAAILAPILALASAPVVNFLLFVCTSLAAQTGSGGAVVLFFALVGILVQIAAFVLAAYGLIQVERTVQTSGRSLVMTGLVAGLVNVVLIGGIALLTITMLD